MMCCLADPSFNPFWPAVPTPDKSTRTMLRKVMRDRRIASKWAAPWARLVLERAGLAEGGLLARDLSNILDGLGCPPLIRKRATLDAWHSYRWRREQGATDWRLPEYVATPSDSGPRQYKSVYEQRLADSLTRLGVGFTYESHAFEYQDARGCVHRYTPDFRLTDLTNTFVEVKGQWGATAAAALKHRTVLRRHAITLLLWDANVIDMIEAMRTPAELVGIFGHTAIAA